VAYGGTASKTLAPALRLGWIVAPAPIAQAISATRPSPQAPAVGVVDQLALAEPLRSGEYDRQVRRMRRRYRRRRDRLVERLGTDAPRVAVRGIAAGLQVVLDLPGDIAETDVLEAARRHGVVVSGLGAREGHATGSGNRPQGIVVGYASPPDHAYEAAIDALMNALRAPAWVPRRTAGGIGGCPPRTCCRRSARARSACHPAPRAGQGTRGT
jgi:GntR family transcriptional regulator/MocR family aminotransferase